MNENYEMKHLDPKPEGYNQKQAQRRFSFVRTGRPLQSFREGNAPIQLNTGLYVIFLNCVKVAEYSF